MTESEKGKDIEKSFITEKLKKITAAANYCYNCNRCVNVCPMSHFDLFSPRKLINDLTFLSLEEALENNNIWECLTCGQCTTYCPMTHESIGVNIPDLVLELREVAVSMGQEREIDRMAQCETHDGIFPLIAQIQAENPLPPNKLDFLEGTDLKVAQEGEVAVYVGCLPIMEDAIFNFEMNYTDATKTVIELLNESEITPVVLNEKCCGHDALWGRGDLDTFRTLAEYNVNLYRKAGVKTVIFTCAEGYHTWKYDYPKIIDDFEFEILYFAEYLLREGILENVRFPSESEVKVTFHDACRLGRLGGKLYDIPRKLLRILPGVKLVEMEHIKEDASCCGVSSFMGCNEYTRILRKERLEEALKTGADYLVVPCPKCLTHFTCYLNEPHLDETHKKLKEQLQIIDLATFLGKLLYLP